LKRRGFSVVDASPATHEVMPSANAAGSA